ncbi:MAG: EVE domain-containing protein [Verrucomicrobiales bacterium]|jgi:predicted RNA-binding protein with PUA-like domain|nr:EVE domain-containing protein [Verrucomicrobiales bacterium]
MAKPNHWLVKQEPEAYPFSQLVKDGKTDWTGVRNFQARNNLRAMKKGDFVLYYHSVKDPAVVGISVVGKEHFPDPTATEGDWSSVELKPLKSLVEPVPLTAIKAAKSLAQIALIRQSRLSVMPLTAGEFNTILKLGKTSL